MNGGVVFLIILIFLLVGGYGGWVVYSRMQANKLGLPPPSLNPFARGSAGSGGGGGSANYPGPAPVGIKGWIDAQVHKFKNRNNRTAAGAYEESAGYNGGGTRGRGVGSRLDPDEAWDARVGNEAYYEEQELGLHEPARGGANPFESAPYGAPTPGLAEPQRGRSRTREYGEQGALQNPFGDENAQSLRGVSPRPLDYGVDTSYGGSTASAAAVQKNKKHSLDGESLTDGRRSLFREEI